jgi:hypothetical protein
MKKEKFYTIELADSNYEAKYEIWTKEGYSFDKNDPIHVGHFYTKQEIDRYIKSVGIHECSEDCYCK